MAKRFFYQLMGESFGPMSGVELRDKAISGDVTPDTLVKINEDGIVHSSGKSVAFTRDPDHDNRPRHQRAVLVAVGPDHHHAHVAEHQRPEQ